MGNGKFLQKGIAPDSDNRTEFSIVVYPYVDAAWDESERIRYLKRFFGNVFGHYLQCVVKGIDYFVTTGKDVCEDHFGSNPVFSSPSQAAV